MTTKPESDANASETVSSQTIEHGDSSVDNANTVVKPGASDDEDPIDEMKSNEKYVNSLPNGDLKYYLQDNLQENLLITILQNGNFKTLKSIYNILKTSKEMIKEAREFGIKVTFADYGKIGSFYEFLEERLSSGSGEWKFYMGDDIINKCNPIPLTGARNFGYKVTGIIGSTWINPEKGYASLTKSWANVIFVGMDKLYFKFLLNSHVISEYELHVGMMLKESVITMGSSHPVFIPDEKDNVSHAPQGQKSIVVDWTLKENSKNASDRFMHLKWVMKRPHLADIGLLLVARNGLKNEECNFLDNIKFPIKIEKDSKKENDKPGIKLPNPITNKNNLNVLIPFAPVQGGDVSYDVIGQRVHGLPGKRVTHGTTKIIDARDIGLFGSTGVIDMLSGKGSSSAGGWFNGALVFMVECDYNPKMNQDKLRISIIDKKVKQFIEDPFKNGIPAECNPMVSCGITQSKRCDPKDYYILLQRRVNYELLYPAQKNEHNPLSKIKHQSLESNDSKAFYEIEDWPTEPSTNPLDNASDDDDNNDSSMDD